MDAAILDYVENGITAEKGAILRYPDSGRWKTVEEPITVYRGQSSAVGDPSNMILFSTSRDETQAREGFAGSDGCVWTITLQPGIRYIDVEEFLQEIGNRKVEEREILVVGGGTMTFKRTKESPCEYTAKYSPTPTAVAANVGAPVPIPIIKVTYDILRRRYQEETGLDSEDVDNKTLKEFLNTNEVVGGRRKTRRFKIPRKMTRKYCKKTTCKKMGFSQKASCRPYKNCFTQKRKA